MTARRELVEGAALSLRDTGALAPSGLLQETLAAPPRHPLGQEFRRRAFPLFLQYHGAPLARPVALEGCG